MNERTLECTNVSDVAENLPGISQRYSRHASSVKIEKISMLITEVLNYLLIIKLQVPAVMYSETMPPDEFPKRCDVEVKCS